MVYRCICRELNKGHKNSLLYLLNNLSSGMLEMKYGLWQWFNKERKCLHQYPPPPVEEVLQEVQDIFSAPAALPPHRVYDHIIPLVPGATQVNARPYILPCIRMKLRGKSRSSSTLVLFLLALAHLPVLCCWSKKMMVHRDFV
jgi:hypothetical protein